MWKVTLLTVDFQYACFGKDFNKLSGAIFPLVIHYVELLRLEDSFMIKNSQEFNLL